MLSFHSFSITGPVSLRNSHDAILHRSLYALRARARHRVHQVCRQIVARIVNHCLANFAGAPPSQFCHGGNLQRSPVAAVSGVILQILTWT